MPTESAWPYPVVRRGSKLGVHSILPNGVKLFAKTLVEGGAVFPLVKAVNDLAWLQDVKQVSPQTITMGRIISGYEGCGTVEQPATDLDKMAGQLMRIILDKIAGDPALRAAVDYWEVVNEPDPPSADGYRRLALLMIKCMELAEAEGLKLAIFTFNAGTPEWDEMVSAVETGVFGRAKQGGHILTLHEGVFGTEAPIDVHFGESIPGAPPVPGAGPLCFRYRYLYHLLQQRGEVVPLVVSEFYAGGGYKQHGIPPQEVVRRMAWYDAEASKDYWMWAFCPFTLGPMAQWKKTDYEFAYPALVEYAISIKEQQNALPSSATPPVDHPHEQPAKLCGGAPREQYKRVYVLLPPDADQTWAAAVVEATWDDRRYTVGSSADDAGIGDLDRRAVIAVNPSRWPADLRQFFQTHYPGVRYVPVEAASPEQLAARLKALSV